MRAFHSRVELLTASGELVRHVPGALAAAMVNAERAVVTNENGKVRSIRLIAAASTHALRIGAPTGEVRGVVFAVREKLDSGGITWKHHPRATDYE